MKIIGEKLRTARILNGLSITDLAQNVGVTKQTISQYENNITEPRNDVYFKLLHILKCPNDFLIKEYAERLIIKNTFFRAYSSADALEKKSQEIKTELVARLYRFLGTYLNLPKLNLPELPEDLSIEVKAKKIREFWQLGDRPIKNMINCLENNGIIVSSFSSTSNNGNHKVDGFTQQIINNNHSYEYCVVVENDKNSWVRKNFSLAHELGHIVLHSNQNLTELTKSEQNEMENEANTFASAFLLPEEPFRNDMRTVHALSDYFPLKEKWAVSIGAMMLRAKNLGIISADQYLRLIKSYSYHNYRKSEPFDGIIPLHEPVLFKKALEILFDNGFTMEQFEHDLINAGLKIDLSMIEELLCLGKGFFDKYIQETDGQIIRIDFKNR